MCCLMNIFVWQGLISLITGASSIYEAYTKAGKGIFLSNFLCSAHIWTFKDRNKTSMNYEMHFSPCMGYVYS